MSSLEEMEHSSIPVAQEESHFQTVCSAFLTTFLRNETLLVSLSQKIKRNHFSGKNRVTIASLNKASPSLSLNRTIVVMGECGVADVLYH